MKKSESLTKPAHSESAANDQGQAKLPSSLRCFARGSVSEAISGVGGALCKLPLENQAGLLSCFGQDMGISVPTWARDASRRLFEHLGIQPLSLSQDKIVPGGFGKMIGLLEQGSQGTSVSSEVIAALVKTGKAIAFDGLSDTDAEKFFRGKSRGRRMAGQLSQLPQAIRIYFVMALRWQELQKLKSGGEVHRWLLRNKIIVPATTDRQVRSVCKKIGFPLRTIPGRPAKPK